MPRSGLLFISEFCSHCSELLSRYEEFRPDVILTVMKVDDNDKKTKSLMEAYDVRGVPTLVLNNEKHSEGEAVFVMLLPTHDSPAKSRRPSHSRAPIVRAAAADITDDACGILDTEAFVEEDAFDFDDPPISTREQNDEQGLQARLLQLEDMRKKADEHNLARNESVTSQQMLSSRQQPNVGSDEQLRMRLNS